MTTQNEIYWRRLYRLQLESSTSMIESLKKLTENNTVVKDKVADLDRATQTARKIHDDLYPYDIEDVKK